MKSIKIIIFLIFLTTTTALSQVVVRNYYKKGSRRIVYRVSRILGIKNADITLTRVEEYPYRSILGATLEENGKYLIKIFITNHDTVDSEREAVVHEMIHVWQLNTGILYIIGGNVILWNNIPYDIRLIPYADRPWECQARIMSKKIIKQLNNERGN